MFLFKLQENLNLYNFSHVEIKTLVVNSQQLIDNPLKDSVLRNIPILIPKKPPENLSVVFILSGFTGNGGKYFNQKSYEENDVQILANAIKAKKAPSALYVFVDAWTFWGGSQFINSVGCGNYEDYIMKELVPAVKELFPVSKNPNQWLVTGGSSGGYGALHLASKYPHIFGICAAIAPDCFFQMSLLPEIYSAWPQIQKLGGVKGVKKALLEGKILSRRDSHTILNAIGMGLCYAGKKNGEIDWPINNDGELHTDKWKKWLNHDPLHFLKKRKKSIKKLKHIYLDVGIYDQFHLQYGSRQIYKWLKNNGINVNYNEFKGNHFDIGDRRIYLWKWLNDNIS
ncbi:MAG: enterochelin esterase [Bdellovibrionales bacterium]|nr:enterochelin esterase [Bdellovibrionales bacterium]